MKVVAFDLGDTLVEYEGIPLSWETLYPDALSSLSDLWRITINDAQMGEAIEVLRQFNTRIHPRTTEVAFATILEQLAACFNYLGERNEIPTAQAFFRPFRKRLRCFPDAEFALEAIRGCGLKCGVFTDVPYGMPTELVLEDIAEAGLAVAFDVVLTSRDVGFRKPAMETLQAIAGRMNGSNAELLYIGNERKDIEAARAFGCPSVLIDRASARPQWGQTFTVQSLRQIAELLIRRVE